MVRTLCLLPLQGAQVWHLVRELRSLMVQGSGGKESPFHIFSSVHLSHREGWEGQKLTGVLGIEAVFPRELSNMARIIPYVYWPKWNPKPPGCTRVLLPDSLSATVLWSSLWPSLFHQSRGRSLLGILNFRLGSSGCLDTPAKDGSGDDWVELSPRRDIWSFFVPRERGQLPTVSVAMSKGP